MKLHILLAAMLFAVCIALSACSDAALTETDTGEFGEATDLTEGSDDGESKAPEAFADPSALKTTVTASSGVPESLKILAVGNSFSVDAMEYLYQLLKSAGVEEITLGNLYYGGCSLERHCTFAGGNSASYKYFKNTNGTWGSTEGYTMSSALSDEKWDYITMQQASGVSGVAGSYVPALEKLADTLSRACPDAKLVWHQTWAYQQNSTHSSFASYGKDQKKMYGMIVSCVKSCVEEEERIEYIIPAGTAVQNLRTSYLGDTLTRDGYHMDYRIGRYVTGLTWACTFTGVDASAIKYNPAASGINADMLRAAAEAVNNAISSPLAVTESTVKSGQKPGEMIIDPSIVLDPADFFVADSVLAQTYDIDLTKYTLLEWDYLENTYYNSTADARTHTPKSGSTYKQNVCCARKYSLSEIPVDSVIICDDGWQYRLEKFTEENAKYTGTRPGMRSSPVYVLDAAFASDANFLTWNIASKPKTDISQIYAQAACHLRIYVPAK